MNRVVPWTDLVAVIEPVYPKAEGPGRPPVDVERMLRLHCLQQWFNLSDPAVEEALYDSRAMRCQGSPKCPQLWSSKIPHRDEVVAAASSSRTSPALSFSLS